MWRYNTNSNFTNEVRISEKNKLKSIVISADPIRRETCNPAGGGFRRIVEIQLDPDSRPNGYPSIPSLWQYQHAAGIVSVPSGRGCEQVMRMLHTISADLLRDA